MSDENMFLLPRVLKPLTPPPSVNWPGDKDHLTWIYGLSDPLGGLLRIIGRSVKPMTFGWLAEADADSHKGTSERQEWLEILAARYNFPVTTLLACVPDDWAETYKRIYVEAGAMAYPTLVSQRIYAYTDKALHDRVRNEALWVLAHAYPDTTRVPQPDSHAPFYDGDTLQRLSRPALTSTEWMAMKNRGVEERDREDFEYEMGRKQAEIHGVPLLGD